MLHPPKAIKLANNVTELTALARLKPGGAESLRQIFSARKADEAQGKPGPIEIIESIHYARWVILDGGTRLLFTSNFDGNLEDYLAEFAERDEGPLNAIFSQCEGWPGARPAGPFIQYVKAHMIPAEYYYSAYPRYTVREIKRALYWKEKTESIISTLLPEIADLVLAIRNYCSSNRDAERQLESKEYTLEWLDSTRDKIRKFLKSLASPTPEGFGKKRLNKRL